VAEALACGTPVIASDIPALREVGGAATTYCAPRDIAEWQRAVVRLLDERRTHAADWERRRQIGADHAAGFDWSSYTAAMVAIYQRLAGQPAAC
jgi:glycosyltransferase involved in cell wall biosynthesis